MSKIRIGISGWRYAPWRGVFYPEDLRQKDELYYASRAVNSIEINGSFYGLQTPERYSNWADSVPDDFIFSVKAPRFITHTRRLRDIETPLANFFASGLFKLKQKLGPILWQFPPSFKYDAELFGNFLAQLPHTAPAAKTWAKRCDERLQRPGYLDIPAHHSLRHAVEIRHSSFVNEEFVALLRKHRVALVVADTAGKWPYREDLSSDFVYLRLHGDKELYTSGYSEEALVRWAERIKCWTAGAEADDAQLITNAKDKSLTGRDVYAYFDNDVKVKAPFDAHRLLHLLGAGDQLIPPGEPLSRPANKTPNPDSKAQNGEDKAQKRSRK